MQSSHLESKSEPKAVFSLEALTHKKQLNPASFKLENCTNQNIAQHAAWAFNHIYSVPYANSRRYCREIARFCHGIQHVSRVAMYIPVFANLYRRYGDQEALSLKEEDLTLLQIAALFHDSGREGEGEDIWEQDSAMLLYYYLTMVMAVEEKKAMWLAEIVANKDANNMKMG